MSYPTHLICRDGYFYYRIKVPVDLQPHFSTNFITKSLKTTDLSVAKAMLLNLEYAVQRVFTLLRTGMLDEVMAKELVKGVSPTKEPIAAATRGPSKGKGPSLSKIIKQYRWHSRRSNAELTCKRTEGTSSSCTSDIP